MAHQRGRIKGKAYAFFFSIGFVIFALFLSLWINTSNLQYFSNFRKAHQDYDYIGKSHDELDVITKDLIRYIQLGGEERIAKHFNTREVHHMRDVRVLFLITLPLMAIALVTMVLAWNWGKKHDRRFFAWAGWSMAILIVLLGLGGGLMATQFDSAFIRFHEIFFNNDLWLLDPRTDMMIRMLPQQIFFEIFVRILLLFLVFTCVMWVILYRSIKGVKDEIKSINRSYVIKTRSKKRTN